MVTSTVNRNSGTPVYRQIYEWARHAIATGELREGDRLPAERPFARELGVSRSTIVRAYDELDSGGFVSRHVGIGTIVRNAPADAASGFGDPLYWQSMLNDSHSPNRQAITDLARVHAEREIDMLSLDEVSAPTSIFPTDEFAAACAEAIAEQGGSVASYTDTAGLPALRETLRERTAGLHTGGVPRDVVVTSGAIQALNLVLRLFLKDGDVVAIEDPSFPCAVTALGGTGAQAIGIPMGRDGIRLDVLEQVLRRHAVKLLIVVPNFHNPTGVVMPEEAKRELLYLTRLYGVTVFSDDIFGELGYRTTRPPSLLSLAGSEHVLEANSLSKVFGGGLRLGWIAGPEPVLERLADLKQMFDINTSAFVQQIAVRLFRSGLVDRQTERARLVHERQRDLLVEALRRECGDRIAFDPPQGGLSLWCELRTGHSGEELLAASRERGLSFVHGNALAVSHPADAYFRLSLGPIDEGVAERVARTLSASLDALSEREPPAARQRGGVRPLI